RHGARQGGRRSEPDEGLGTDRAGGLAGGPVHGGTATRGGRRFSLQGRGLETTMPCRRHPLPSVAWRRCFDLRQCPTRWTIKNAVLRTFRLTMTYQEKHRPDQSTDASLLFRWMDMLQVDRSDLARDDPLLFHELQGVCALCLSKEACAHDLAHQFDNARWNEWRVYCPNSALLLALWRDAIIGRVEAQVPLASHDSSSSSSDLASFRSSVSKPSVNQP